MNPKPPYQLQDSTFLETVRLEVAEQTFNNRFEPRNFTQEDQAQSPNFHLALARLPYSNIFVGDFGCTMNAIFKEKVKNYHLFIPLRGKLVYRGDNNRVIEVGNALLLSPGSELNITWQDNCTGISVVTQQATFTQFAANFYGNPSAITIEFPQQIDLSQGVGLSLANALHTILSELEDENSLLSQGVTTRTQNELLLTAMLNTNTASQKIATKLASSSPSIANAIDFIQQNLDKPLLLTEIAEAIGISTRTLQLQFNCHFGLSPMKFVNQKKLEQIRQKLLDACPATTSVGDIAAKYGFYHASNFSQKYKRHFGESPSETLRTQL